MRKALALAVALVAAICVPATAAAPTGFFVSGGRLYESNGTEFVMRGVNHAHTWYPHQTRAFADVKALGANTVRVVLASGQRWAKNDTTGYGEQAGAATLAQAVEYWLSVKSALVGQEKYVIVDIGNEPYGNSGYQAWTVDTSAADPDRNTVFSIHMYGVFDTAAEITDYLGRFRAAGLPIVVGEFGHDHSGGNPDEDTILATAQSLGIGYLGWSWSGNGGGVEYLDMATAFDPARLTPWGERIVNGTNGIRATSREAAVYAGGGPDPDPGACTASYRVTGQWQGRFQAEVTVTNRATTAGGTVTIGFTGSWSGANTDPSAFALNDTGCTHFP